jgi:hypothetical protein
MPRDSAASVVETAVPLPAARAVVLSSPLLGVTGNVFELGIQWPKLVLSPDAVLGMEADGWWLEVTAVSEPVWLDGRRLSLGDRISLSGGEIVAVGGRLDESGRVVDGCVVLFDATPQSAAARESGTWENDETTAREGGYELRSA